MDHAFEYQTSADGQEHAIPLAFEYGRANKAETNLDALTRQVDGLLEHVRRIHNWTNYDEIVAVLESIKPRQAVNAGATPSGQGATASAQDSSS